MSLLSFARRLAASAIYATANAVPSRTVSQDLSRSPVTERAFAGLANKQDYCPNDRIVSPDWLTVSPLIPLSLHCRKAYPVNSFGSFFRVLHARSLMQLVPQQHRKGGSEEPLSGRLGSR